MENTKSSVQEKSVSSERSRALPNEKIHNGIKKKHCVTVNAEPSVVYAFWRDFKNFPLFMKDVEEVRVISPKVSHWVIKIKNAADVEWDAEIITDRPGEVISWQSIGDSTVKQAGSVWFRKAPANLGTVVDFTLSYEIPGGKFTELATKLTGEDPENLMLINLRRFKALIETGEVPTIEGQASGRYKETIVSETH